MKLRTPRTLMGKLILTSVVLTIVLFFCKLASGETKQVKPQPQPQPQPQAQTSAPTQSKVEVVVPKQPYDSTKAKLVSVTLENLQLKANEAQRNFQDTLKDLQQKFNLQKEALDVWENSIRSANGWDASYMYDVTSDTWTHKIETRKPSN